MSRKPKPEGTRVADLRQRIPGSLMPDDAAKLRSAALAAGVSPSRFVEELVRAALFPRHPLIGIPVVVDPSMPDGEFRLEVRRAL